MKRTKEILSLDGETVMGPALSPDDRQLYFLRRSTEADIWLMTFK